MAEPKKSEEREEEKKDAQTEERSEKREERHAHEDEKKDSKRGEHGKRSSSKKRDHESRVEKRAKAESENEIHAWTDGIPLSPVWWAPVFTTLMIVRSHVPDSEDRSVELGSRWRYRIRRLPYDYALALSILPNVNSPF